MTAARVSPFGRPRWSSTAAPARRSSSAGREAGHPDARKRHEQRFVDQVAAVPSGSRWRRPPTPSGRTCARGRSWRRAGRRTCRRTPAGARRPASIASNWASSRAKCSTALLMTTDAQRSGKVSRSSGSTRKSRRQRRRQRAARARTSGWRRDRRRRRGPRSLHAAGRPGCRRAATGVDDAIARRDAPPQDLVEQIDVDRAELFVEGHRCSLLHVRLSLVWLRSSAERRSNTPFRSTDVESLHWRSDAARSSSAN